MSSGVEFDEDRWGGARPSAGSPAGGFSGGSQMGGAPVYNYGGYGGGNAKGISGWLQRHGIAKSDKSAQYIMLAIIILNIAITGFVYFTFLS